MNFFEAEYAKAVRRVKRIRENPDPTKLQANLLLYDLDVELREHQLEAIKAGKPLCNAPRIPALNAAMGFQHIQIENEADRVTDAERYFDVVRAHGYPDYHCDRAVIGIGMILSGDVPRPTMTISFNSACDPIAHTGKAIGQLYSENYFCLDVDSVSDKADETVLSYITDQLGEWIEFAESRVPGIKYHEDRLVELTDMDRQAQECMREIYELRKLSPCPISGQDVFRLPRNPSEFPNPGKVVSYYQALRDEVGERAAKKIGAAGDEKVRIVWTITAPFFSNVFQRMESRGASIVHFQVGLAPRWFGNRGYYGDEHEFGRKLKPLEEQARFLARNSWGGLASRWVDDTMYFCRELRADGIVNFEQWGCVAAVLARKVMQDRVQKELGIPVLFVEGRNLEKSDFDVRKLELALDQFVTSCIDQKNRG